MNNELKKYQPVTGSQLIFRWSITFIIVIGALLLCFQSCSKSNGGTTGGNPLDSSLPQTISVDAQ
ncbi:MAG: hypothetical protein ACXVAX_10260 [Pseudobdellovibrio sp.]